MMAFSTFRPIAAALALGLAAQASATVAQDADVADAGTDDVSAAAVSQVDFAIGDVTASASMPCAEPGPLATGRDGVQGRICIVGDSMFMFVSAEGEEASTGGPMVSDFDAAYAEVVSSSDTAAITEEEIDGRRTMQATRGPDPDFGAMVAVELRDDAVVYAVAIARPNRVETLSDEEKQVMRDFVDSLEIVQ